MSASTRLSLIALSVRHSVDMAQLARRLADDALVYPDVVAGLDTALAALADVADDLHDRRPRGDGV